jgi:hypothetical protein
MEDASAMSTTDRLRSDIDSGRTGDKVPANDPAAAPLGTDDEAAGTPPSRGAVDLARQHEVTRAPQAKQEDQRFGSVMVFGAIVAGLAVLLIGCVLLFRGMA